MRNTTSFIFIVTPMKYKHASRSHNNIASSNVPNESTLPDPSQDAPTFSRIFKSDIWNYFEKFIEDGIRKEKQDKHCQKSYSFPKRSVKGYLKRHLDRAHSPNKPRQIQLNTFGSS